MVSFVVFLIPYVTPGDPARKIIRARVSDPDVDPAVAGGLRRGYGLDQPLLMQYWDGSRDAVQGDFGVSYASRVPVTELIGNGLSVTAVLAITSLLIALLVAVPLGSLAAVKRGKAADNAITTVTQAFVAIPEYWLAPVLILVFALKLGVLPSAGWRSPASMVLPCLTLALRPLSYFTQVTRASMVAVLDSPHMVAARARGLSFGATMMRHGLRNGLLPVITLFSVWLGGLLGGSVVVEVIFGIPGMGRLLYEAVVNSDIPVIQAAIVLHRGADHRDHHGDRRRVHPHQPDSEVRQCRSLTTPPHHPSQPSYLPQGRFDDPRLDATSAPGRPVCSLGSTLFVLVVLILLLTPLIAPYDPAEQDLGNRLADPGAGHLLGTDQLGRDVLSRLHVGRPVLGLHRRDHAGHLARSAAP